MKNVCRYFRLQAPPPSGMTLVEVTLVIALILGLASIVVVSSRAFNDWKKAKEASEELRAVYSAQKTYLADHPTHRIASVTAAVLVPYLPTGYNAIPTVESLEGDTLTIDFKVMPPVIGGDGGGAYDPSGDSGDSLWDVGPH